MAEPPAHNLSSTNQDPPTTSTSSPLEAHFAKHSTHSDESSYASTASGGSYNASGGSYNASRQHGDAPSVGASIRSGDDATIRSGVSFSPSQVSGYGEEETARLLSGGSRSHFPNPYRKKQQQAQQQQQQKGGGKVGNRVSFSEQLFGKTYDSNSSVVGSVVGSITGSVSSGSSGRRKRVPRLNNGSTSNGSSTGSSSGGMLTNSGVLARRLLRLTNLKKNATILSIMALGMMIFIGGVINLSGSINDSYTEGEVELREDESRGLGYEVDGGTAGGIMDNLQTKSYNSPIVAVDEASPGSETQQIDWNKVPPHLRGYYSKTFGPPPADTEGEGTEGKKGISYRKEADDYETTQFSNKEQAKAIQSIGQEAVLGFRPVKGGARDYHAQGELNKELTVGDGGSNNGGFGGPMLGKEDFASQEEQQLGMSQQQLTNGNEKAETAVLPQGYAAPKSVDQDEEQKRLAAQEAALAKASTAAEDARKRRADELALLRASNGLSSSYYSNKQQQPAAESQNAQQVQQQQQQQQQQAADEEAAHQIELARQKMKEEAEAAQKAAQEARQRAEEERAKEEAEKARIQQQEAEAAKQNAESEKLAKLQEELRLKDEEMERLKGEARQREEEEKQREAARQQELARQEAEAKAAKLKLEQAKQKEEQERAGSEGSFTEQVMNKYLRVPFKDQTLEMGQEQLQRINNQIQQQQQQQQQPPPPPQQQQQIPTPETPPQNLPEQSPEFQAWRNEINSKFHERLKSGTQVDHLSPKNQPITLIPAPPPLPSLRKQIASGELPFDTWRSRMHKKLHEKIQEDKARLAPRPSEVKDKVSQKMEEVENAQNAVMKGESSDLDSIASLQQELSELLALMGGG